MLRYNLLVVLGPTAVGKTAVAVHAAHAMGGEVISCDSRQVYRGMTIGTGKDLEEYVVDGVPVPYHLIDIAEAGEQYNVHAYQRDFEAAWRDVTSRGRVPVLCGGSGMYLEAAVFGYDLLEVPVNAELRQQMAGMSDEELTAMLRRYKTLHNHTDTETRRRLERAVEIAVYTSEHILERPPYLDLHPLFVGIGCSREVRRQRIADRLEARLKAGMVEEVKGLLDRGLTPPALAYYGLEYKFVTQYLIGELTYDEMVSRLLSAIRQFAKRQMTWFRRMERRGADIHWLDVEVPMDEKLRQIDAWWHMPPEARPGSPAPDVSSESKKP